MDHVQRISLHLCISRWASSLVASKLLALGHLADGSWTQLWWATCKKNRWELEDWRLKHLEPFIWVFNFKLDDGFTWKTLNTCWPLLDRFASSISGATYITGHGPMPHASYESQFTSVASPILGGDIDNPVEISLLSQSIPNTLHISSSFVGRILGLSKKHGYPTYHYDDRYL